MRLSISLLKQLKRMLQNTVLNKNYITESRLKKSVSESIIYGTGVVLEIGCGTKPYKKLIESRTARYISMEYPGAKDYFGEEIKEVDFFGDCQLLSIRSETIDTIICTEVIEHLPEPFQLLQEIWRVLKKEGILILTVPSTFQIHMEPHDYFRFTRYGLDYLLQKAGFRVISIQCRGHVLATIGQCLSTYLNEAFVADPETKQPKLFSALLILPLCGLIQIGFLFLDKFTMSESLTLGYTVIAKK